MTSFTRTATPRVYNDVIHSHIYPTYTMMSFVISTEEVDLLRPTQFTTDKRNISISMDTKNENF